MDIELKDFSPPALCAAIKEEWGIDVKPDDITLPSSMGTQAHTVIIGDMVVKF